MAGGDKLQLARRRNFSQCLGHGRNLKRRLIMDGAGGTGLVLVFPGWGKEYIEHWLGFQLSDMVPPAMIIIYTARGPTRSACPFGIWRLFLPFLLAKPGIISGHLRLFHAKAITHWREQKVGQPRQACSRARTCVCVFACVCVRVCVCMCVYVCVKSPLICL